MQKRFRIPTSSLNALKESYTADDSAILTVIATYDGMGFDYVSQEEAVRRGHNMQYITEVKPDPENAEILIVEVADEIQSLG